jgi:hypothetical protein
VARLPSSFRQNNRTTRSFRRMYSALPTNIRELCRSKCRVFHDDPNHPSLRVHDLQDRKKGSHRGGSISVSITMRYRSIFVVGDDGVNVWYWVGTHAEYDRFTGG